MAVDIKAFIAQVLGKIADPGLKAQAEVVFNNADVQAQLKDGVAGQSEIDRQLADLRTKAEAATQAKADLDARETALGKWHTDLTGWRKDNEELVAVGAEAKKAGWKPGTLPPANQPNAGELPAGVMTEEMYLERTATMEQAFLGFQSAQNDLMRRHFATFGEILDVTPLLKHPEIRTLGLDGVYAQLHKEALAAKATEAQKKHDDDIRADERQKVAAANAQLPYPLGQPGVSSGSPLDAIGKAPDPAVVGSVVDRATAEYTRLQAARPA